MPTPIELNLSSLLPTLSYLPEELVPLANSLLSQSRTKAASLKPEEEIGRTYACCHIACQRLGHKLALEIANPTPPVKPKVYSKLHSYFNTVLRTTNASTRPANASSSKTATASSSRAANAISSKPAPNIRRSEKQPQRQEPPRPTTRSADNGPVTPGSTPPSLKRRRQQDEADAPYFTMPLIKYLSETFSEPDVKPHVFAGVTCVLQDPGVEQPAAKRARGPKQRSQIASKSIPAIVFTLFVAVAKKMYGIAHADEDRWTETAMEGCRDFCAINAERVGFTVDSVEDLRADFRLFTEEVLEKCWKGMEWWENVPVVNGAEEEDEEREQEDVDVDVEEEGASLRPRITATKKAPAKTPLRRKEKHGSASEDEDDLGPAGLLPGLGTMFQPAVDWLSDERRAEYAKWKRSILRDMATTMVQ